MSGALTVDEFARLRVPLAALPGLDPVGLEVSRDDGLVGVVIRAWPRELTPEPAVRVAWVHGAPDCSVARLSVTLEHSATADRVARWCAARRGVRVGATAPHWGRPLVYPLRPSWLLGFPAFRALSPALIDLDGADQRRLPDGSLYVDRLALVVEAQFVAAAYPEAP